MQIEKISPSRAVDNAFLQETIAEKDFEQFRSRLLRLLNHADEAIKNQESEEHLKGLIKPFLNNTNFGEDYYINTKERQDLAIHNGKTGSSSVGVILEAKRPSNKEMITADDLNRKAFQESILYYLRERIENGNEDIKHIIITDIYQWFVFDAQDFERYFYDSKKLKGWYSEWKQGQKVSSKTQFVYDHLYEFIDELDVIIKATQFDIRKFRSLVEKDDLNRDEQKRLVPLFKFFTPTHLLKLPFASDSNNLNKAFYRELLYIMGLQEYKEKGSHYITRLDEGDRHPASLIENTITQLKSLSVLSQISNRSAYGDTEEEQLFNVAIQLLITWINRILFLKLLEAQLYKYHREDERFRFLNHRQIEEYDDLNKLFFQVLAVPEEDRSKRIIKNYSHIPYLNSSLFDVADIEREAVRISELEDGLQIPVHSRSKIRNKSGERLKGESISVLEYLLRFLDAYSFNSEGAAEVQKEAKTLINASVLGRIFEKINGYKDGSFFTPGYITEYMCRETIRRAVVQKFNDTFEGWNCESIDEVRANLSRHEIPYQKANAIVNSTTICDPAVGSGHFLVSALNELIAIKHDLRIFVDEKNERFRDVEISVDNDELSISVGADPFFEYRVHHEWKESGDIKRTVGVDTQRLQRALFREKNILIENCLFGVDINPNSVNICRLRLWVELLKHAYYREESDYQNLEVLPNIDINIKQGNSLVSRFGLDSSLSSILKNNNFTIEEYKEAVHRYKKPIRSNDKSDLKNKIKEIKESFEVGLQELHPERRKLKDLKAKLIKLETQKDMFGDDIEEGGSRVIQIIDAKNKIENQDEVVQNLENASFYDQAFEWRIEFPEVLNNDGDFIGFDVVTGNPPYIRQEELGEYKEYFKSRYDVYNSTADIYTYFFELAHSILKDNGWFSMITSNKFMRTNYGKELRNYLSDKQHIEQIIDFGELPVFTEAATFPAIFLTQNQEIEKQSFDFIPVKELDTQNFQDRIKNGFKTLDDRSISGDNWSLAEPIELDIIEKMREKGIELEDYIQKEIYRGLLTGYNKAFVIDKKKKEELIDEDTKSAEIIKPVLKGNDIRFYQIKFKDLYLIVTKIGVDIDRYPAVKNYLDQYKDRLQKRYDQGKHYWELRACDYYDEFEKPKIIYPDIAKERRFTLDTEGYYLTNTSYFIPTNDKYILGVLNSKLIFNYYKRVSSVLGDPDKGGRMRWFRQHVSDIPIANASDKMKKKIESNVDQILTTKQDNPEADTSELEAEIDQLVYELYGLSEEEIAIVEGSVN